MPETYGLPEEEPTREERVRTAAEQVIAGQSVVRRVVLYVVLFASIALGLGPVAVVAAALLMATDVGLA